MTNLFDRPTVRNCSRCAHWQDQYPNVHAHAVQGGDPDLIVCPCVARNDEWTRGSDICGQWTLRPDLICPGCNGRLVLDDINEFDCNWCSRWFKLRPNGILEEVQL